MAKECYFKDVHECQGALIEDAKFSLSFKAMGKDIKIEKAPFLDTDGNTITICTAAYKEITSEFLQRFEGKIASGPLGWGPGLKV